ncbi:DUF1534 domain-containing protein [Pseudomonas savastanoi]|nr:DUF1534 domain-containing protein [Pseudomonas savastanoi]
MQVAKRTRRVQKGMRRGASHDISFRTLQRGNAGRDALRRTIGVARLSCLGTRWFITLYAGVDTHHHRHARP